MIFEWICWQWGGDGCRNGCPLAFRCIDSDDYSWLVWNYIR